MLRLTVAALVASAGAFVPARQPLAGRASVLRMSSQPAESSAFLEGATVDLSGGTVLVSGFLDDTARDDQFIFDILHTPKSWAKIIAFNADSASAKKRLISRSARYTGLLDVLNFIEGDASDAAAMKGHLDGVDAWINFNADAAGLAAQADVAIASGVKYLVSSVVVPEGSSVPDMTAVAAKLDAAGVAYAFVASGPVDDAAEETGLVRVQNATAGASLPEGGNIGRADLVRVVGELAGEPALSGAVVGAFAPVKADNNTQAYLRSLRSKGVTRAEELAAMISGGLVEFEEAEAERIAKEIEAAAKKAEAYVPITDESRAEERMRLRYKNLRTEQKEFFEEVERRANRKLDLEWGNVKWKISMDERDYRELNWSRVCSMAMKEMYATLRWQSTLEEALGTNKVQALIGEIPAAIEAYPSTDGEDESA
uniref:Uncharacterized protein n=1 Tax=Phaeomonas parva TaxID=124430 RepID=A0A7S1UKI3_9STRA|mmetsp:Transcript_9622/g.28266  ORF Transcript_9622/g.28266 Transcript_9622/m.28266 type:complete len:427 (+) Transcript_9622:398-1678(+)